MFAKFKIGARFQIALGIMLVLVLVLGLHGSIKLQEADDSDTLLFERGAKPLHAIGEYRVVFQRAWVDLILAAAST